MEETNSTQETEEVLISSEIQLYINLWLLIIVRIILSVFGIISNVFNQNVFVRLGLGERVNFTLFCLSFADFCLCALTLATAIDYILIFCEVKLKVDQVAVTQMLLAVRGLFVDLSSCLVAFISVERCVCITLPFTFNMIFNARKTKIIILFIVIFLLFNYIPLFSSFEMIEVFDISANDTIFTYMVSDFLQIMTNLNLYILTLTLAVFCQICVFVCAILMHRGLRKSSMVRSSMQATKQGKNNPHAVVGTTKEVGLSKRENRIVRMVMILACLYVPTALPQIAMAVIMIVYPDVYYGPMANIYETCHGLTALCATANSSFSIVIYYRFNTSYRDAFLGMTLTMREPEKSKK